MAKFCGKLSKGHFLMRVLFNTYPVAFDCPGGGEIQLLKTKESLERLGVKIELFNLWKPQFNSVDLVHYFSVQGGSINFCSYVKRKGLPLIISPIIWLGNDKESYPLAEIKELLNLSDLILPSSMAELNQLSHFFNIPKEKFFMVRNGVDPSFSTPISGVLFREKFNITGPFILNVANIEPRKNQLNLIQALKGLGLQLVILGNIRDQQYFNECLKIGKDFVNYIGYIDHESDVLKSAYTACDLFVLPSLLETPGLSALEAGAAGAKIVITEIGCTREYFGDMVTYVDPYNIDNIRNGILTEMNLQRDDALKKYIIENFTWPKIGIQIKEAYERVLKNK